MHEQQAFYLKPTTSAMLNLHLFSCKEPGMAFRKSGISRYVLVVLTQRFPLFFAFFVRRVIFAIFESDLFTLLHLKSKRAGFRHYACAHKELILLIHATCFVLHLRITIMLTQSLQIPTLFPPNILNLSYTQWSPLDGYSWFLIVRLLYVTSFTNFFTHTPALPAQSLF